MNDQPAPFSPFSPSPPPADPAPQGTPTKKRGRKAGKRIKSVTITNSGPMGPSPIATVELEKVPTRKRARAAEAGFSNTQWADLVQETVAKINLLSATKGQEYSGNTDRLANFRRNGEALGLSKEQVWAVYAGKHWDAISNYVKDIALSVERKRSEPISDHADNLIVYLLLFKAMLIERGEA